MDDSGKQIAVDADRDQEYGEGRMQAIVEQFADQGVDDILEAISPLSSSGSGALSRVADRNPFTHRGPGDAGVGATYKLGPNVSLSAAYLAGESSDPSRGNGLFGPNITVGTQLDLRAESLSVALTYVRKFFDDGDIDLVASTGSEVGKDPFGSDSASSDNIGIQVRHDGDRVTAGLFFGYQRARATDDARQTADLLVGSASLSLDDLVAEGDVLRFAASLPPKAIASENGARDDRGTAFAIELHYKFPVSDAIEVTPGFYAIFNPEHDSGNGTIIVGALRTRFRF